MVKDQPSVPLSPLLSILGSLIPQFINQAPAFSHDNAGASIALLLSIYN